MSTNANNGQTPRTSSAVSCQREDDDSDIDPPFDYSAPEDDSDRNGGGDDRKGYECPD